MSADGFCGKCAAPIVLWGSMALDVGLTHRVIVCHRCYTAGNPQAKLPRFRLFYPSFNSIAPKGESNG